VQLDWQVPPEQTSWRPQALPHAPQFELSVFVFAQYGTPASGAQSVWPCAHDEVH
jgi:hypothetical protein